MSIARKRKKLQRFSRTTPTSAEGGRLFRGWSFISIATVAADQIIGGDQPGFGRFASLASEQAREKIRALDHTIGRAGTVGAMKVSGRTPKNICQAVRESSVTRHGLSSPYPPPPGVSIRIRAPSPNRRENFPGIALSCPVSMMMFFPTVPGSPPKSP